MTDADAPSPPLDRPAVVAVDLAATLVFGLEGGLAAVDARLDLFGVAVVGLVTATGGGMIRDVLLGDAPPRALRNVRYLLLGLLGGMVAFALHGVLDAHLDGAITLADAVGLSLFAVSGAALALEARAIAFTAVLLGTITAVGGGVLRDLLLDQVPTVLQANVYALAAAAGATALVLADRAGWSRGRAMVTGGVVCFGLRMVAVAFDWQLPVAS